MTTARAIQPPSPEDVYANLDETAVPSCRRITIPAMPRAKLLTRELHALKAEPLAKLPAHQVVANETAIPAQSVRRMKVAVRVSGTPEQIQEPLTEALLRDPRRE